MFPFVVLSQELIPFQAFSSRSTPPLSEVLQGLLSLSDWNLSTTSLIVHSPSSASSDKIKKYVDVTVGLQIQ